MFSRSVRAVFRRWRRQPGFTLLQVSGLAIGLACGLLILRYVACQLSYDNFHPEADRLYRVTRAYDYPSGYRHHFARVPETWINELPSTFPEIERLLRLQPFRNPVIRVEEELYREDHVFAADPYIFRMFRLPFLAGDPQTALERPESVVISASLARRYFGDGQALGRSLEMVDGHPDGPRRYTVTGVMEDLPGNTHLALDMLTSFSGPQERTGWAYIYLLLSKPADAVSLKAGFPGFLARHIDEEDPAAHNRLHVQAVPDIYLHSDLARELGPTGSARAVYFFGLAAFFILFLAAINYVNLTLARSLEQRREMGMRKVLGATISQMMAYVLLESLLTALAGLALALIIMQVCLPLFQQVSGMGGAFWNLSSLLAFCGAALLLGFLAGLFPAWRIARQAQMPGIRDIRSGMGSVRGLSLRRVLVGVQVSVSLLLMVGTALSYRQFQFMRSADLGLNQEQVLALPDLPASWKPLYYSIKEQLSAIPGVQAVSAAMDAPSRTIRDTGNVTTESGAAPVAMDILPVDRDFFDLLEVTFLAGTGFELEKTTGDAWDFPEEPSALFARVNDAERGYVINRSAMRALGWTNPSEAIGKQMSWSNAVIDLQRGPVLGVVSDFHFSSLHNAIRPLVMIYEPRFFGCVLLRVNAAGLDQTLTRLADLWEERVPAFPFRYFFLDDMFADQYTREKRQSRLMGFFAVIALTLAGLGVFGLAALSARRRRKELSIRRVVGANTRQLVGLLGSEFFRLVGFCALLTLPVAWYLGRVWLRGFPYASDMPLWYLPAAFLAMQGLCLIVVGLAARRAARVNPAESLRAE